MRAVVCSSFRPPENLEVCIHALIPRISSPRLEEAPAALRALLDRTAVGKIVLTTKQGAT
jgi:hypothetical protein